MPTQEHLLRDLLAVRACPKLCKAVEAAAAGSDAACLSYEQLLQVLQSLPISDYSGAFEAACRALLDAMRAGDDPARIQALTAELCHETPTDWGMTSGTTGNSKYFPILPLNTERTLLSTGKPASHSHLRKFPLQPFKHPTYSTSPGCSSSVQDTEAPSEGPAQQEWRHRTLSVALAGPCEELPGGGFVGSISSVFASKYSKAGISMDRDLEGRDLGTRPVHLMYAMAKQGVDAAPRYYALWLCAAAEPGLQRVTFFTDLFAGNMLTANSTLQHHWQDIVADLTAGQMSCSLSQQLPPEAISIINNQLASIPAAERAANARHIQRAMDAHTADEAAGQPVPLLGLLMPNLHAVLVVVTGSHSKFWPSLSELTPKEVPVVTPWHAATEGLYAISRQLIEPGPWDNSHNPAVQQFVMMASGNCFCEFLPVDPAAAGAADSSNIDSNGAAAAGSRAQPVIAAAGVVVAIPAEQQQQQVQQQGQRALTMDDLQVGKEYELIITTFAGLTRYRTGDVVRVDGFMLFDMRTSLLAAPGAREEPPQVQRLPVVSFKGRAGCVLNLVWEKYDEGQLLQAVHDTVHDLLQQQQQGQLAFPGLAEFTIYEDTTDKDNKHYAFFWELLPSNSNASAASAAAAAAARPTAAAAVDQQVLDSWAAVLNANLGKHNTVYAGLLAVGQVGPASIKLVAPGAFKALKDAQVAARGISPSQFKMPTVVAPDSTYAAHLHEHALA